VKHLLVIAMIAVALLRSLAFGPMQAHAIYCFVRQTLQLIRYRVTRVLKKATL
jgi:hypothetical protein